MGAVPSDDHRPRAAGPAAVLGALVVAEVAVAIPASSVFAKLRVRSRAEAVQRARQEGWPPPERPPTG